MLKKLSFLLACIIVLMILPGCTQAVIEKQNLIVCTVFPQYDFARTICGDKMQVKMLLPLGAEAHDYEPTAQDIKNIAEAKLFIYIGGESDVWVERILKSSDYDISALSLIDCVTEPLYVDGEDGREVDEHIWTSPKNALLMAQKIYENIVLSDPENEDYYKSNYESLTKQLVVLSNAATEVSLRLGQNKIIIGDRNPFGYLARDYGLDIEAAYHGCGHDSEPSAAELASLIGIAKESKATTVYCVDFSNGKLAATIAENLDNAVVKRLHSCHNVTSDEFANETYYSLMLKNFMLLTEDLNEAD